MSRLLLIALLALLALAYALPTAQAHYTYSDSDADTETEADSLDGIEQEVLDSAAQEIESSAELSAELNEAAPFGTETAIYADSAEAASMEQDAIPAAEPGKETFAFLAELESPKNKMTSVDVEQHLDTIATEIGSLFQTEASKKAQAEKAQAEAYAHSRKGRLAAKKAAHAQAIAAQKAAAAAAKAVAAVPVVKAAPVAPAAAAPAPSKRQQKLISRLDGYRVARGHTEDVSVLEATAKASHSAGNGYSMPSAYAPAGAAVVAGLAPAAPFNPFQGQVNVNPALAAGNNALLQSLGLGLPGAAPAAVPVAAPSLAGVGNLLQALQKIKQEQENKALLSSLATLLAAQKPAAAPAVIPSPFNYGQSFVATPNGYVNPNLLPQTFGPRLLPGQLPGQSPSYPTFIPAGNAAVGVADEQPNPFEDHKP